MPPNPATRQEMRVLQKQLRGEFQTVVNLALRKSAEDGAKRTATLKDQIDEALAQAAEQGAKRALAAAGLDSETAADDIRQLRALLHAYRSARRSLATAIMQAIATAVVASALTWAALSWNVKWLNGGN